LGPGMHFDRLKRREVITLLGGAAAVWPLAASAQQQSVHPLIGVLSPLSAALAARNIAGFRSGLRDLGYLEGRDITLALRYGDGAPERMAPLAQELVALKPDVLMIGGARSGALAAQAAMRTIPIVIITTDDPVALGVANVGALFVGDGPTLNNAREAIAAMAARLRLPAMYGFREFADAGGLMSYGYGLPDTYRQSARLVVRILKGDRPGDLPFERPARYELIVNLKAAKAIGLTLPDSFVLLADEVIE
jgi:ABC-type uncharacterized transport system substrate-binding protein